MSDLDLKALRACIVDSASLFTNGLLREDALALLDEVERLRAENAVLRAGDVSGALSLVEVANERINRAAEMGAADAEDAARIVVAAELREIRAAGEALAERVRAVRVCSARGECSDCDADDQAALARWAEVIK
jgi:hypothetical protein